MAFHIFVFLNFVCTLKIKGHATDKGRIQGRTDSRLAGIFDRRVEARPFGPRALSRISVIIRMLVFHYCERKEEDSNEFVLIYCVEGEGWFELDGERYDVGANQFFILPKYKAHAYGSKAENPWTIYWIHFDGAKPPFFSVGFSKPHDISPAEHSRIKNV